MKSNSRVKMNLMTKLMSYFLALIILPVSVLGVYSYQATNKALKQEAEATLKAVLDGATKEVKLEMEKAEGFMELFADRPTTLSYADELQGNTLKADALKNMEESVEGFMKTANMAEEMFILNDNGKVVLHSHSDSNIGTDLSAREYFTESIQGKKHWNNVVISQLSGNPVVVYSMPLKATNGNTAGVLALTIKLDTLTNALANVKVGTTGYAYMIDSTGLIVSHPIKEKILQENISVSEVQELKEQALKMMQGQEGTGFYTYEGIYKLNMYKPVGHWSVAVNIPVAEYMATALQIRNRTLLIGIIGAFMGALIAYFAARGITAPIKQLMELMGKAEKGDLTVQAHISSNDEVGELASSFNHMISGQKSAMLQVLDTANQVGSASQQTSSVAQEMASSAECQTASVEELAAAMNEMTTSVAQVATNVSEMAGNIQHVSRSMEELGKSAEDVARSAEETSETIVDVTQAIQQINGSIEQVANNARNGSSEALKTVAIAQDGKKAVDHTVLEMDHINKAMANLTDSIKGLGKAAVQIGDIVEVIDDIAEQTNLLALNAAIEAARAGEHGKGFAVVAGAIGSLAEKSGDATKDITNLIKQIQEQVNNAIETTNSGAKQVENGVNLVKDTGLAFERIFEAVQGLTKTVNDIDKSTDEQAQASKAMMKSVEKLNDLSMQVSAAIQEQASAIQEVIQSVENINTLSQEVAGAAEEQSASSEEILATAESVNEMANEVSAGSEEVASTAQNLASQASALLEIVSKFKV